MTQCASMKPVCNDVRGGLKIREFHKTTACSRTLLPRCPQRESHLGQGALIDLTQTFNYYFLPTLVLDFPRAKLGLL
jgi:hypothetical protein